MHQQKQINLSVIHTKLDHGKANVSKRIEDMDGTLLVEATAMFIQPRYAKLLKKAAVPQALGELPALPSQTVTNSERSREPVHLADRERLQDLRKEP